MALTYFYGTMSAGKSLRLLTDNFQARAAGLKTVCLTAEKGVSSISSRTGLRVDAHQIDPIDLLIRGDSCDIIYVDEAQWITKSEFAALLHLSRKVDVKCYGLRSGFTPMVGAGFLMQYADTLVELEGYCADCGKKATRHAEDLAIAHGSKTRYRAVCTDCFFKGVTK